MTSTEQLCRDNGIAWHEAADSESLASQLADTISQRLQSRIDSQGAASLVVSGGSTPAPVFHRLAKTDISWDQVQVTLADERWVGNDHEDSNERLVRSTLLVDKAASARFVPLFRSDRLPAQAVGLVDEAVAAMVQPFTVVILGMGSDGHTASLFPDAPEQQLKSAMELNNKAMVAILQPPSVAQVRISLTRSALLRTECRILHITGENKKQVLMDALLDATPVGSKDPLPARYSHGMKPIVGLLSEQPQAALVYWSPGSAPA